MNSFERFELNGIAVGNFKFGWYQLILVEGTCSIVIMNSIDYLFIYNLNIRIKLMNAYLIDIAICRVNGQE